LNKQIYRLRVLFPNTWNNTWQYIQSTIEEKLEIEAQKKIPNPRQETQQINTNYNAKTRAPLLLQGRK
jgi:hypothetical protein